MSLSENGIYPIGVFTFFYENMKINHWILATIFSDNPIWQPFGSWISNFRESSEFQTCHILVGGLNHLETYEFVHGKDYAIYYGK